MIRFVKMHGIGNDYVYIDVVSEPALEGRFEGQTGRELIRRMSDRHRGVGSDGVILVCGPRGSAQYTAHSTQQEGAGADARDEERPTPRPPPSGRGSVRMRMFNADGSESEMCGNGVRCVAKFAHDRLGIRSRPMMVETGRGVLAIDYRTEGGKLVEATVDMGEPILEAGRIPVDLPRGDGRGRLVDFPIGKYIPWDAPAAWMEDCQMDLRMTCVSMGNPHAVVFCGVVAAAPLETLGPFFERQPVFPNRVNLHVVEVLGKAEARMRTWERGTGQTQACGTGACAVLVAGVLTGRLAREAVLHLPGGDLRVRWDDATGHVFMTGPAEDLFEGVWPD